MQVHVQVVMPRIEDAEFDRRIEALALSLLSHSEVRVRNVVAQTLGILAAKHGAVVWERCKDTVLTTITENYVRFHVPKSGPLQQALSHAKLQLTI